MKTKKISEMSTEEINENCKLRVKPERKFRIYTVDALDKEYPLVGEIETDTGELYATRWRRNGRCFEGKYCSDDIVLKDIEPKMVPLDREFIGSHIDYILIKVYRSIYSVRDYRESEMKLCKGWYTYDFAKKDGWEYSIDMGKTWHKCEMEVRQ